MRAALAAFLLAACSAPNGAAPEAPLPAEAGVPSVTLMPLAEGVWMHTSYKDVPPYGPIRTNGLVVRGEGGVWLVDTAWTDEQTETVLASTQSALGVPVTHAVLTHAHDDKMGGVAALRARGVETYAHALSNELASGRGLAPAEHDTTPGADGAVRLPGDAPRGVEVFFPGAAHTTDNLIVAVPAAGVLFGGCMIRPTGATNLGNTADGDVGAWAASVRRAAERFPDAAIVVPSHGAPGDRELLAGTVTLAGAASRP